MIQKWRQGLKNDNLQAQIFLAPGSEDIDKPWKLY